MMIKIFAVLLLASSLQQIAAEGIDGSSYFMRKVFFLLSTKPEKSFLSNTESKFNESLFFSDLCWCINPWIGTAREWMGDPLKTCPDWCYVSCDSDCRDIKDAKGKDRCWSSVACNMDIPPRNQIEIKF